MISDTRGRRLVFSKVRCDSSIGSLLRNLERRIPSIESRIAFKKRRERGILIPLANIIRSLAVFKHVRPDPRHQSFHSEALLDQRSESLRRSMFRERRVIGKLLT